MRPKACVQLIMLTILVFLSVPAYSQTRTGMVGFVSDEDGGFYLQGALITIEGTAFRAVSDRQGKFTMSLPAGNYVLLARYLGYEEKKIEFTVTDGSLKILEVKLKGTAVPFSEQIVEGIRLGQTKALNTQKNSDNIKNVVSSDLIQLFPDPNAAEALQRLPGLSIQRDQGEGRYVLIRGTEARLNSMMINGERIPSPEAEVRSVALDAIPADAIASIEVTKALTPDMDADAIGGSVNLITKSAFDYDKPVILGTLGSGYNNLVTGGVYQGGLTYGRRFGPDNKFGLLLSGSYYQTNRGSDNNEFDYDDAEIGGGEEQEVLTEYQLRDYVIDRKRIGISATLDYRLDDFSHMYFRGIVNEYSDQEYRRRLIYAFDEGDFDAATETSASISGAEAVRELKDRFEKQSIRSFAVGGNQHFNLMDVDYHLSYSFAEEKEPHSRYSTFKFEDGVDFTYDLKDHDFPKINITNSSDIYDPTKFEFEEFSTEKYTTQDKDYTGSFNIKIPFTFNAKSGMFKSGFKYRGKSKDRHVDIRVYDGYSSDLYLDEVLGNFEGKDFLNGKYRVGRFQDAKKIKTFFNTNSAGFEEDSDKSHEETDAQNYDAEERVLAGYAMTTLNAGPWSLLAGLRAEKTNIDYRGNTVVFDEDGDYESTVASNGKSDYLNMLPSLHVKYRIDQNTNLRAAYTNSIARPDYYDLVPFQSVSREDEEIASGNSNLKPTVSKNLDLMVERYFQSVGLISGGFFYKKLNDFIYANVSEVSGGAYDGYEQTVPVNGKAATLWGVEMNWQQQMTFLPSYWSGLGVYLNYTYTQSEAEFPTREAGEDKATLPGQSEHVANFAISYERGGFNGRISANLHGKYLDEVGETKADDIFYDRHFQLDASASQRLTHNWTAYLELLNLTNAPLRYYRGSTSRPVQQEFYSWTGKLGLKFTF